jgi:hypothetical protein
MAYRRRPRSSSPSVRRRAKPTGTGLKSGEEPETFTGYKSLRFAAANAPASNVSSAIFCANIQSPAASPPSGAKQLCKRAPAPVAFNPVAVAPVQAAAALPLPALSAEQAGTVEIEFATGGRMRITGSVDASTVSADKAIADIYAFVQALPGPRPAKDIPLLNN